MNEFRYTQAAMMIIYASGNITPNPSYFYIFYTAFFFTVTHNPHKSA